MCDLDHWIRIPYATLSPSYPVSTVPGVDDAREEPIPGCEGEDCQDGCLDEEEADAGRHQVQVEVHPHSLAHHLGLAQDGQALSDGSLPEGWGFNHEVTLGSPALGHLVN